MPQTYKWILSNMYCTIRWMLSEASRFVWWLAVVQMTSEWQRKGSETDQKFRRRGYCAISRASSSWPNISRCWSLKMYICSSEKLIDGYWGGKHAKCLAGIRWFGQTSLLRFSSMAWQSTRRKKKKYSRRWSLSSWPPGGAVINYWGIL